MTAIKKDLGLLYRCFFHPFDSFYEICFRANHNLILSHCILILYGIIYVLRPQYSGFLWFDAPIADYNSLVIFFSSIIPFLLFTIANWSITTLFDGSGSLKSIYTVLTYALVPKILAQLLFIIISNYIIVEEVPLLLSATAMINLWFYYLVFCGLCVIHEYTVIKNIITVATTYISSIIIIFLGLLYFSVLAKIVSFIFTVYREIVMR